MTQLVWGAAGTKVYQAGVDKGVLYLPDNTGVAWSGLTEVEEDNSQAEVAAFYLDGIRYLTRRIPGEFLGTIKAYTYPDEFQQFDGVQETDQQGIFAYNQEVDATFGLSYRTKVGNDIAGLDYGYKIHVLYNLTAQPDNVAYSSLTASPGLSDFSWKVSGVPVEIPGIRPTSHIVIDSRKVIPGAMTIFENLLYGSPIANAALPDPTTLNSLLQDVIMEPISEPI